MGMFVTKYKCPHCGEIFHAGRCRDALIPTHCFPRLSRAVCPGSGQAPRGIADRRPLWKDQPAQETERSA